MEILRFITAGNIDDGKSTLIGRLLFETGSIKEDIIRSITGADFLPNLAFVTDGLKAEREQGITIDVAYKYLSTAHRKFIIIDAPGHFQYTKNLVTGATGADLMIILIDVISGLANQTILHSRIAGFLGIRNVIVAVNKMDAIGYDKEVFDSISAQYGVVAATCCIVSPHIIPVSALQGDNVIVRSRHMPWYSGSTIFEYLNHVPVADTSSLPLRFSIQYADKDQHYYMGLLLSGTLRVNDTVVCWPSGNSVRVVRIIQGLNNAETVIAGHNIVVYFEGETEAINRGTLITEADNAPVIRERINARMCWLDEQFPLEPGQVYLLQMHSYLCECTIEEIVHEGHTAGDVPAVVKVNDFARVVIYASDEVTFDSYNVIRETGRGILINKKTNYTCAAVVII